MRKLSNTQWSALSSLLDAVLELPHTERDAWLASLRERDPTMANLVAESLEPGSHQGFEGFLEGLPPIAELPDATFIGKQIGPYAIDAEVGRGGMGSIWRAHRNDGRYEGNVAIKFVHASWVGNSGEQRFQQEGRLLSRLNHPHIARLLDAGVLERSQPYIVLEYVQGQPLDKYCAQQTLSLRARIELFLAVLEAVAHAHVNLIVHRDIKPGNVLVTAQGVVKLLDFGIAKLVDDTTAAQAQVSAVALTPMYAAPEQILGQPITTATDVYALGLMLYLLLTGRHPTAGVSGSRAAIVQATLNIEAPRASSMASLAGIDARVLSGDLDNILHMAIQKAPAARYSSAAAFADDLRRYLADEPVLARTDTVGYRAAKFVMRHRAGTALATITITALLASVVMSAVQTRRASGAAASALVERNRADAAARLAGQERDFALARTAESQDLSELTQYLLGEALPADRPQIREEVLMRGVAMVRSAEGFPPVRRADMLEMIALHFENNRDFAHAQMLYNESNALARKGSDVGRQASTACHLAQMRAANGATDDALAAMDSALSSLPPGPKYADSRVVCHLTKSAALNLQSQLSIPELEAAARDLRDMRVADHWLEADVLAQLTGAYTNAMRVPEALRAFQQEERLLEATGSAHIRSGVVHFSNESVFFWKIGRPLDALDRLEHSQRIDRERGTQDVDDAVSLLVKARIAAQLGDVQAAVAGYERAVKKATDTADTPVESVAMGEKVAALIQAHEFARAQRALITAEHALRGRLSASHWMFGSLRMQSALLAEHRGESARARRLAAEAVAMLEAGPARGSYQFPIALVEKSRIEQRCGNRVAARADADRAVSIYAERFGKSIRSASFGDALMASATAAAASGDLDTGRQRMAQAALHYESSLGIDHPKTRAARAL